MDDKSPFHRVTTKKFYDQEPYSCIMKSIDPTINLSSPENRNDEDLLPNRLESLNIHAEESLSNIEFEGKSILLIDANEKLLVTSERNFLERLKIGDDVQKVKVVSIFGNTGEGKSYTLNQAFFNGENVFKTSADQLSCTLGVWAAYDPNLNVICLDTEGLLGITKKEDQRTRLLLKVLAVSDIVIYRTRAERLQRDMYTFLGGASKAYREHFEAALKQLRSTSDIDKSSTCLGPSVIIFHETKYTHTLQSSVSESPEDILRAWFNQLQLDIDAFSSLKYIGVQSKDTAATSFTELKNAIQLELDNTTVRSARNPKFIYLTLKGLNDKFKSQLSNVTPQLYLPAYFTCQAKCQSCEVGCTLSMGHVDEGKPHYNPKICTYQHQFENIVYLCKRCLENGEKIVVKPSALTETDSSWSSIFNYVWSGYVIECRKCGEIYRSRQHWYGNKSPEEGAISVEIVHIWPGEKHTLSAQNSAQRLLDGVGMISDVLVSVSAQPTRVVTSWVADNVINPSYWRPNNEITHCYRCKIPFNSTASKHHCRACGEGFCEGCSSHYQRVPERGWYEDVRVCDGCYKEVPTSLSRSADDAEVKVRKYSEVVLNSFSAVASMLDIPKEKIKEVARPTYWTPDSECSECACCGNLFGTLIPLHHCRDCGKGVCDDCSTNRKPVPLRGWQNPVRVCDKCVT